jgi:exopolysaccharide biosynthesis polyprenyl glycosylphosphotransferase
VYAQEAIATPLIIVGFNALSRYICDQIVEEATYYVVLGFLDDTLKEGTSYHNSKILGPTALLSELAAKHSALEVLIVLPEAKNAKQLELIVTCERSRVRWKIVPWPTHVLAPSLETDRVGVIPVLSSRGSNIEGLNYLIKRSFDLVVGVSLLSAALPVIALGALAILMFDGRPIFFCQTRIGIHRQPFRIIKFRTMRRNANEECHRDFVARWIHGDYKRWSDRKEDNTLHKLVADTRITAVGRWLRRFSVDELPQLLNVIRGEMSLIGPRPALPYEVELYQAGDVRRFDAPPGITGLWQVSGRSRLSFQEMIRLDLQYQENWSLAGDIAILLRTVPELLRGGGL